ncbi:unnamed protein product [Sphagnum balticum]
MRLLNTVTIKIKQFGDDEIPPYAILSHTWDKKEFTFQDIVGDYAVEKEGYAKVKNACAVAAADEFEYIWVDTCCIDKTSSAELSEAINSMYRWYQRAEVCYAYLTDVPSDTSINVVVHIGSKFSESRWFRRGWTLQELIAPSTVIFLDKEWQNIGTKSSLRHVISRITGIPVDILLGHDLELASVAQKMSWAARRETARAEDRAYCLMGIFGIHMSLIYGEGERAFVRLQEYIMKVSDDHSLFAWRSAENRGGLLATSPSAFVDSGNVVPFNPFHTYNGPLTISNNGIHLALRFIGMGHRGLGLAILHCTEIGKEDMLIAIYLRDFSLTMEHFERVRSEKFELLHIRDCSPSQYAVRRICVRQGRPTHVNESKDLGRCVVKLSRIEKHRITPGAIHFHSNWELFDGVPTITEPISDGVFGRLIIVCKDGFWFQVLLNKGGRLLSANVVTNSKSDSASFQSIIVPKERHDEADRIMKQVDGGRRIYVAVKKQIQLESGKWLTNTAVEIDYQSPRCPTEAGIWLENMILLGDGMKEETPLSYAAGRGLEAMIKVLLAQNDIQADSRDERGRTPLSQAAEGGHEGADSKDREGQTPLLRVAKGGHEAVAQLLLSRSDVQADSKDQRGQTPLLCAAEGGHEALVRLLLVQSGVSANSKDCEEITPLSRAAEGGHESVVKLLLVQKDIQADSKDREERTPLWRAARGGHKAVVKLLLARRDVQADSKYREGRTPLWRAAEYGHEAVIKLLLAQRDVQANSKDRGGQTPLSRAAEDGHEAVVQLLLARSDVQADSKDRGGQTPLSHTAEGGHEAVAQLLLARSDVQADSRDFEGRTPLWRAAGGGHEAVVKLLLARSDVHADSKGGYWGQTPLSCAAEGGHEAVVQLLLARRDVQADSKDHEGRTPLWRAVEQGHEAVAWLLLARSDVQADLKGSYWGQTPLSRAAERGHEAAAEGGHKAVVKLLLARSDVQADSKDQGGRTSLSCAAERGHEAVVKLLLARGDVQADSEDKGRQTPLSHAADGGHEAVVQLLLARSDVQADSKDRGGRTPLWHAAEHGHEAVVKLLLARRDVQADSEDKGRQTPLSRAVKGGHEAVVKLLQSRVAQSL